MNILNKYFKFYLFWPSGTTMFQLKSINILNFYSFFIHMINEFFF